MVQTGVLAITGNIYSSFCPWSSSAWEDKMDETACCWIPPGTRGETVWVVLIHRWYPDKVTIISKTEIHVAFAIISHFAHAAISYRDETQNVVLGQTERNVNIVQFRTPWENRMWPFISIMATAYTLSLGFPINNLFLILYSVPLKTVLPKIIIPLLHLHLS